MTGSAKFHTKVFVKDQNLIPYAKIEEGMCVCEREKVYVCKKFSMKWQKHLSQVVWFYTET